MAMTRQDEADLRAMIVEDEIELTLHELSRACGAGEDIVTAWVVEGALEPMGSGPTTWRFAGASLRRARIAARLSRDLEINAAAVALVLDLLDEIERLKGQRR
jgi:chaperone modulatory protein CbpM